MKHRTNIYKTYNLLIKIIIIVLSYFFIYKQVFFKQEIKVIWDTLTASFLSYHLLAGLSAILVLAFLNWSLETVKWKFLIRKTESISFLKAYSAVLSGITVSTFTPNRIGEYFGRVFSLKKTNPWEGVFITLIGSISQLLITLFVGSVCTYIALTGFGSVIAIKTGLQLFENHTLLNSLFILALLINLTLLLLYFNVIKMKKIKWPHLGGKVNKVFVHLGILATYSGNELIKVLLMSLARYLVFTTQFYLLLNLFHVHLPFITGFVLISAVYYTMAAIPTVALTELGVRGSVSLFFIGLYFEKTGILSESMKIGILSSSVILWIINLIIPAIIGSFFVLRLRFFENKHNS